MPQMVCMVLFFFNRVLLASGSHEVSDRPMQVCGYFGFFLGFCSLLCVCVCVCVCGCVNTPTAWWLMRLKRRQSKAKWCVRVTSSMQQVACACGWCAGGGWLWSDPFQVFVRKRPIHGAELKLEFDCITCPNLEKASDAAWCAGCPASPCSGSKTSTHQMEWLYWASSSFFDHFIQILVVGLYCILSSYFEQYCHSSGQIW